MSFASDSNRGEVSPFSPFSPKELLIKRVATFFAQAENWPQKAQWIRLEVSLAPAPNILSWLAQQKSATKWYWCSRSNLFEMGAIGESDCITGNSFLNYETIFQRIRQNLSKNFPQMRYYGGFRFNGETLSDLHWQSFGAYFFVLPQFELLRNEQTTTLAYNFYFEPQEKIEEQYKKLLSTMTALSFGGNFVTLHTPLQHLSRRDLPSEEGWNQNVQHALTFFEQKKLEKLVLARKTIFSFAEVLKPLSWLSTLKQEKNEAFYFCFQPKEWLAFVGVSPELLYRRQQNILESEAVAGTRKRGQNHLEDEWLAQELLQSEKDLREHHLVYQRILAILQQYCHDIEDDAHIQILKLSQVQHLYHKVNGTLKANVSDAHLLQELHPTPAVGGIPKEKSLSVLTQLEPFDRGWYAAPVGWIGNDAVEFAVAIRAGLFEQENLSLFTGAGIVPGSNSVSEWDELENKMKLFRMRFL